MINKNSKKEFEGKTILLLNSGTERSRFIFSVAEKLGIKIVVLNDRVNWSKRLADDFILVDNYNHPQVLNIIRSYLTKHKIDGVVTFEEEDVELLTKICHEFHFIGNGRSAASYLRNKFLMRQQCAAWQINQPEFALITNTSELQSAIKKIGFPAVIKPVAGTGSNFVIKVENKEEAEEIFDFVRKNATPKFDPIFNYNQYQFLYEEYLEGAEVGVEAVIQNGQTNIVAIVDRELSDDPYFIDNKNNIPSKLSDDEQEMIERTVLAVHRALGVMNGVTHTELMFTENGPAVIEIAGRMGGQYLWDGVKAVWGVDLVEQAFRVALGMPITVDNRALEPKKYWVCKYLEIEKSGIITTLQGGDEVKKLEGIKDLHLDKEVGDAVFQAPLGFDTMGWIVANGDSHSEAEGRADSAVDLLKIKIIPFDPESSVGQTSRKNKYSSAFVERGRLLAQAKIEKLRHLDIKNLRKLHVGVLGNIYKNNLNTNDPSSVADELMSVGFEIQRTLQERGYRVSFFDMNESPLPIEKIQKSGVDIIFNVCERINDSSLLEPHGAALLDIFQIPYTGSTLSALSLCMDKIKVKKLLSYHNIPTAKFDVVYSMDDVVDEELRYPLIVKPANTDNSIGITNNSVVTNKKELKRQLEEVVVKAGRPALVEEYIEGDEYDVSIVGNDHNLQVLPLSRSTFDKMPKGYWHIYPFESKFGNSSIYKKIQVQQPAKIPEKLARLITEISIDTYNILGVHDYARIELRVDKNNNPYIIELNPNPSIGSDACTPKCAKLAGYDYGDFLELILSSAIGWYKNRPPFYHLAD